MSTETKVAQAADICQDEAKRDPLAAKLAAAGFFTPTDRKITSEQAEALAPAPAWSSQADYSRESDDQDGGFWIVDKATASDDGMLWVGIVRETAVTGTGTVAHAFESVRVKIGDEDFWLETHYLKRFLDAMRAAGTVAGVEP